MRRHLLLDGDSSHQAQRSWVLVFHVTTKCAQAHEDVRATCSGQKELTTSCGLHGLHVMGGRHDECPSGSRTEVRVGDGGWWVSENGSKAREV